MTNGNGSWLRQNSTLIYFLIAQFIAAAIAGASMLAYFTKLEERVHILEVRGSPHLAEINNRLTVTEKETQKNSDRVDRVVDIMTRELNKPQPSPR